MKKVLPFKIPKTSIDTLIFQEDKEAVFYNKLHEHEEIQMSLILAGDGNLIVGDTVTHYKPGDILIFGSRVPHVLKSAPNLEKSHMISIFFTKNSFGEGFFGLSEFDDLSKFFNELPFGIKIASEKEELKELFLMFQNNEQRLDRFILFLKILKLLGLAKRKTLSSTVIKKNYTDDQGKRMAVVFELVMNNFYRDINLSEVSNAANMTSNAFCRYFKQRTNKTFFQFLTEVRIQNACNILSKDREITIAEAAFVSGFKNLSHFNRKFKNIKGLTPSQFKKNLNY